MSWWPVSPRDAVQRVLDPPADMRLHLATRLAQIEYGDLVQQSNPEALVPDALEQFYGLVLQIAPAC